MKNYLDCHFGKKQYINKQRSKHIFYDLTFLCPPIFPFIQFQYVYRSLSLYISLFLFYPFLFALMEFFDGANAEDAFTFGTEQHYFFQGLPSLSDATRERHRT